MNELILYPSLNKLLFIYDLRVFCFCFLSVTEFGLAQIILLKIGVLVLLDHELLESKTKQRAGTFHFKSS